MKQLFKSKPGFTESEAQKTMYNVGCMLDIPLGKYVRGKKGENLMHGGLSVFTAVAGRGNTYKSTIAHYMILSAASKVSSSGIATYINTYDTEVNVDRGRLQTLSSKFDEFKDIDIQKAGIWSVTDRSQHIGNEWYKILKDYLRSEKLKNRKDYMMETPFIDKEKKPIYTIFPTFGEIDSISAFSTSDTEEIQNKNELGESGGNTIHMRLGLAKTRLIMEIPGLCNSAGHYLIMTAHVGQESAIQQGPHNSPPKKLQHMRMGEKIKGVADNFFFLPNAVWQTNSCSSLINQATKGPEYPRSRDQVDEGSQDLNIVGLKQLRNKSGPSGFTINIIVSQSEGVLATLSEFHFIKENSYFGIEGSNINYSLDLYPSVKIGRTTVRSTIDTDPLLRRAIKITADLLQITQFYKKLPFTVPTPKELYEKLSKEYDWETLLKTRDFWTFNNYDHPVPFLSTMDLIEMYHGLYTPYWYNKKASK